MIPANERNLNQAAFRKMKDQIDRTYPPGRYLAVHNGNVIVDAADDFEELDAKLVAYGHEP